MKNHRIEYHFLKRAIQQFSGDVHQAQKLISNRVLSDDEVLEIMAELVVIKESIEGMEKDYLNKGKKL